MQIIQLLGSTFGIALLSGINLYATTLTLGLGIRFDLIRLPENLHGLAVLARPEILIAAGILYIMEFVADKIPWVDSFWDSFHTIIRPIGGALLAAAAIGGMNAPWEYLIVLLSGGIAWSSHTTKAGTRLAVNHSPEPVSNIGLSLFEDFLAVGGTLFVINHPMLSIILVVIFLLLFIFFAPRLYRLLKFELLALLAIIRNLLGASGQEDGPALIEDVPSKYDAHMPDFSKATPGAFCVSCFSSKGIKGGRNRPGYLYRQDKTLVFMTRKLFRVRKREIDMAGIINVSLYKNIMYSRLVLGHKKGKSAFLFLRDRDEQSRQIHALLKEAVAGNSAG